MHFFRLERAQFVLLLAGLICGALPARAEDASRALPTMEDFAVSSEGAEMPHFDRSGDYLVWCRLSNERWSLLRAEIGDIGNPTEVLSQLGREECHFRSEEKFVATGLLKQVSKGYQLQISRSDGEKLTIDVALDIPVSGVSVNDRGEALVASLDGNHLFFYRLAAEQPPYKIPDDPDELTVAFDDQFWPVLKISVSGDSTSILKARINGHWQAIRTLPISNLQFNDSLPQFVSSPLLRIRAMTSKALSSIAPPASLTTMSRATPARTARRSISRTRATMRG
jgi:hypothetical protein